MNMRLSSQTFLSLCLLVSYTQPYNYCCDKSYKFSQTYFSQRPQGNNQALVMMGTADKTHLLENDENYINFNLSLGYRQSFEECNLGKYFFTQLGPIIVGPANTNVDVQNLQLGLASNFQGNATLSPTIKEFLADFDFFFCMDKWQEGLWARLRFPLVHTNWCIGLNQMTSVEGNATYPDHFASETGTVPTVYYNLHDALCGGCEIGDIPPLCAGKIGCSQSRFGLSDIHFEFGYDFLRKEHANMGLALIGAIATGQPNSNTCNAYLFSPSIGSQRSWQLGMDLRGQYEFFHNDEENKKFTAFGDFRVVHLFPACTRRLLSLNANNSSAFNYWLLLNRYDENGTFLDVQRAANLLNQKVKVSASGMIEFTLMLQMLKNNWDVSLGYNFWFRSRECLSPCDFCLGNGSDYYVIKDSCTDATWSSLILNKADSDINTHGEEQASSLENLQRYALTAGDINCCVAEHPTTYSNMLFGYLGYNFQNSLKPYLGLGGQLEVGRGNVALSMWGVYIKGGLSF